MPPRRDIDLPGAALALLVSLLWGVNPIAIKVGLEDTTPLALATMRFVLGGAITLVWASLTGRLAGFRVEPHEWRPLLVVGALLGAQVSSLNIGTSLTSAAHSAVLLNMYAVHTVVLAHFAIPGDRLTRRSLGGVVISYAGIAVLLARADTGVGAATLRGDVIMVLSAFVLGARTVYLAHAVQRLPPVKLLLAQVVVGVIVFAAGSLAFETGETRWTARLGLAVGFQGGVITGFNFVANLWLLRYYRPSALAAFFLTQPVFGVIAAALFYGDPLTVDLAVATIAVVIGIALTSR